MPSSAHFIPHFIVGWWRFRPWIIPPRGLNISTRSRLLGRPHFWCRFWASSCHPCCWTAASIHFRSAIARRDCPIFAFAGQRVGKCTLISTCFPESICLKSTLPVVAARIIRILKGPKESCCKGMGIQPPFSPQASFAVCKSHNNARTVQARMSPACSWLGAVFDLRMACTSKWCGLMGSHPC